MASKSKRQQRRAKSSSNPSQSQSHQTQSQPQKSQSQSQKATSQPKRERGTLLTLFLIIIIGSGILQAVLYIAQRRSDSMLEAPVLLAFGILHAVLNIIAAVGIWNWKKWGIYLYIASSILGVIIGVIAVGPIAFFSMLLPAIILGYLLTGKWSWFE